MSEYKSRKTRLRIINYVGESVKIMDLTDLPNANTQCLAVMKVEQQCDMLHWHVTNSMELPAYGP